MINKKRLTSTEAVYNMILELDGEEVSLEALKLCIAENMVTNGQVMKVTRLNDKRVKYAAWGAQLLAEDKGIVIIPIREKAIVEANRQRRITGYALVNKDNTTLHSKELNLRLLDEQSKTKKTVKSIINAEKSGAISKAKMVTLLGEKVHVLDDNTVKLVSILIENPKYSQYLLEQITDADE